MSKEIEVGFKECSKCEYHLRCEECVGSNYREEIPKLNKRIKELEEQLANAIVPKEDKYVIVTNGWKNRKYGIAKAIQTVQYNYILETDGRMGCYVPCMEFGEFSTLEEAQAKLKEIKSE